jgi:hypothetical protein
VQHDCQHAGCSASGRRIRKQERLESGITELYIEHKPSHRYIINTHALHNAHLVRRFLPRHLTVPLPFTDDRRKLHDKLAERLRMSQNTKRAAQKKARADARQQLDTAGAQERTSVQVSEDHESDVEANGVEKSYDGDNIEQNGDGNATVLGASEGVNSNMSRKRRRRG